MTIRSKKNNHISVYKLLVRVPSVIPERAYRFSRNLLTGSYQAGLVMVRRKLVPDVSQQDSIILECRRDLFLKDVRYKVLRSNARQLNRDSVAVIGAIRGSAGSQET